MDSTQLGFFFCKDQADLISKQNLITFIQFQQKFPNAVFLYVDYKMLKLNSYPFRLFKLSQKLVNTVDMIEIYQDESNIEDLFKRFIASEDMFKEVNFKINDDVYSLQAALINKQENTTEEARPTTIKESLYTKM